MARSQVRHNVKDAAGNVIRNALCYVYETTTTTPVTDLFAAASGGSALPSLTSDAQGDIIGWLDVARTVDIKVTDNSNTAYYPSVSSRLLSWTDFTETVSVLPAQAAVDASVAAEAVLRASADTSEATTRATADTTNATAVTTEATARAAADTAHNINAGAHTNLPYVLATAGAGKELYYGESLITFASSSSYSGTPPAIPGCSAFVTIGTRPIMIEGYLPQVSNNTIADAMVALIKDEAGTKLAQTYAYSDTAGHPIPLRPLARGIYPAGTIKRFDLMLGVIGGTASTGAGAPQSAIIRVWEV